MVLKRFLRPIEFPSLQRFSRSPGREGRAVWRRGSSLSSGAEQSKKTHFVLISRTSERVLLHPVRFTTDLLLQEYDNCTAVKLLQTRGRTVIV